MKHLTKVLLVVVAIVGLAIGMSAVVSYDNSSNNVNTSIFADNDIMDSNCGSGKCGGDDTKADVKDSKCGEGKCGGDDAKADVKEAKCGEGKCGGNDTGTKKSKFMDMDTNGDGKVSNTEFADHGTKEFPNKDANNDGKLTNDECMMFDSFNTDGNEYLSKAEFEAGHNKMFSKLDENNDGFIDANESKSMHKSASAKCGDGKCGGDEAKADAKDSKCGEGKCG